MTDFGSWGEVFFIISTHILTRRMTGTWDHTERARAISTHILTRRMTSMEGVKNAETVNFNSHPHKEDDSNFKQKQSI